jgi:hypothetical protein
VLDKSIWSIDGWFTSGEPVHPDRYEESLIRNMNMTHRFRDIRPDIERHTQAYIQYWGQRKFYDERRDSSNDTG